MESGISTSKYFDKRSKRYHNSIKNCPNARILDMIPHAYFIELFLTKKKNLKVLDAFGGTGFISKFFINISDEIVIVDESEGMMKFIDLNDKIKKKITNNDFKDILDKYGEGYFDVIISHGGFHHAVIYDNKGKVLKNESQNKQNKIIERLSKLTSNEGIMILADIAEKPLKPYYRIKDNGLALNQLDSLIPNDSISFIQEVLNLDISKNISLESILSEIENNLTKEVDFLVPNYFFDYYISRNSFLGHKAHYSNFEILETKVSNLNLLARTFHKIPWIFNSEYEVGWFFKEKFSIFSESQKMSKSKNELKMYNLIKKYLGIKKRNGKIFTNWGVTYSVFGK